ncbi:type III pantothenate kinase [Pedobacter xixiisoli]|uniref:Type III pantothenate kinase n=1 Tax=Pedobacter xixiisoli TaxID=1476464 RepID=A0A286ACU0_9SPHI|nr:type III pantothenate kinase [Pedobacter xixiisoli]SOD19708.1 type III pantothenate kinase [Pedobacter xixiisoli]
MHNLVIDIGNTFSKLAIFEQKKLIYFQQLERVEEDHLLKLITEYQIGSSTVSSVSNQTENLERLLKTHTSYTRFSTEITGGIKNHYESPKTLGLDRWAKVIAAHCLYQGDNTLMIDAGTCITYDVLTAKDEYFGGSISLGLNMRFKALNHYTGRLPLVNWDNTQEVIDEGTSTQNAIKRGVLQGALNEIEGFIALEHKRNKNLKVVLTGGDSLFLTKQLKNSIFAAQITHEPYLVLKGLNEVITL